MRLSNWRRGISAYYEKGKHLIEIQGEGPFFTVTHFNFLVQQQWVNKWVFPSEELAFFQAMILINMIDR
jgi:hypothetical protein